MNRIGLLILSFLIIIGGAISVVFSIRNGSDGEGDIGCGGYGGEDHILCIVNTTLPICNLSNCSGGCLVYNVCEGYNPTQFTPNIYLLLLGMVLIVPGTYMCIKILIDITGDYYARKKVEKLDLSYIVNYETIP